jgi:hypothetical protein
MFDHLRRHGAGAPIIGLLKAMVWLNAALAVMLLSATAWSWLVPDMPIGDLSAFRRDAILSILGQLLPATAAVYLATRLLFRRR